MFEELLPRAIARGESPPDGGEVGDFWVEDIVEELLPRAIAEGDYRIAPEIFYRVPATERYTRYGGGRGPPGRQEGAELSSPVGEKVIGGRHTMQSRGCDC